MKIKIFKYTVFTIITALTFISCEDFNTKNFPDYDEMGRPTNVATYTYSLTSADFVTIGNYVKENIESQISEQKAILTAKQNELKAATNATDSAKINSEIAELTIEVNAAVDSLQQDSAYIAGSFIKNNKCFSDVYPAADYVATLLKSKYKYADVGSSVTLTYKYVSATDTATITATNKYTVTIDDYNALGEGNNQPGQNDYFSSSVDPDVYIPRLLAVKYPLAQSGDVKLIRYKYSTTPPTTIQTYSLYLFNGSEWIPYSKTEQFVYIDSHEWIFDPTITFTVEKTDYLLAMQYLYKHDGETAPFLEGYNDWTSNDTLKFVINPKYPPTNDELSNVYTEFLFGLSWNYGNIDARITNRSYSYDNQLQAYFKEVNDNASLDDNAKKDAKTAFIEKRIQQGLALLLCLKYPDLEPRVKGVNQHVKLNVQVYDGNRWYWTYNFQCVETGKFQYIERTKWK